MASPLDVLKEGFITADSRFTQGAIYDMHYNYAGTNSRLGNNPS